MSDFKAGDKVKIISKNKIGIIHDNQIPNQKGIVMVRIGEGNWPPENIEDVETITIEACIVSDLIKI